MDAAQDPFAGWVEALESRALADLRFPELRRAVQALSSLYVEQRGTRLRSGAAFDSAGKRAAYSAFFAPLHFLAVRHLVAACAAAQPSPKRIVDLGCGTGAAGAAWALACAVSPRITGVDRSGWALEEAARTWRDLRLTGTTSRADLTGVTLGAEGIVAAYSLNELPADARALLLPRLLSAARNESAVLVVEPVARGVTPWWDEWSEAFAAQGGESRDWRFAVVLPRFLAELDHAAGLNHDELTARSLWLPRPRAG